MSQKWSLPLIATMIVLLATCQAKTWVPTGPTPDVPGYGDYTEPPIPFPPALDCSIVPAEISLGPSWKDLRIGKTTFEELIDILEVEEVSWSYTKTYFDYISEDGTWDFVAACFSRDVLSMLEYGVPLGENSFENDFIQNFGNPDYVTWGGDAYTRTAIWPEEGMLVILEEGSDPTPTAVILFSPIPFDEFGESWLWQALPDKNGERIPDVAPMSSWEDPWGIATYGTYELRVKYYSQDSE
ncbi:MAG: hypothetical protein JXB38_03575 [Anaerolineales bacterium]|nr:hypothetical protein [Anaerolineales bacterium]